LVARVVRAGALICTASRVDSVMAVVRTSEVGTRMDESGMPFDSEGWLPVAGAAVPRPCGGQYDRRSLEVVEQAHGGRCGVRLQRIVRVQHADQVSVGERNRRV